MTQNGRRHLAVIHNPTAGGAGSRRFDAVIEALRAAGCRVDLHTTASAEDARRLARDLSAGPHEALVVAGGDGTINDAVNGMAAGSAMPFGIIPLGTANVLAWEIGLAAKDPRAIAEALRHGQVKKVRLGRLTSAAGERLFLLMAGAGFDAQVVAGVNLALKRRIGKLAYVWEALRQLFAHGYPRYRVVIDGMSREAATVIVAKASHYGGDYVCAAEARLEDPVFQVCLFTRPGPLNTLRYSLALRRGALHRLADVQVVMGCEVAITEPAGAPLQLDGDPAGVLPAGLTIAPAALSLICPVA
jgi:diacylglycerol kinase (ATP)